MGQNKPAIRFDSLILVASQQAPGWRAEDDQVTRLISWETADLTFIAHVKTNVCWRRKIKQLFVFLWAPGTRGRWSHLSDREAPQEGLKHPSGCGWWMSLCWCWIADQRLDQLLSPRTPSIKGMHIYKRVFWAINNEWSLFSGVEWCHKSVVKAKCQRQEVFMHQASLNELKCHFCWH